MRSWSVLLLQGEASSEWLANEIHLQQPSSKVTGGSRLRSTGHVRAPVGRPLALTVQSQTPVRRLRTLRHEARIEFVYNVCAFLPLIGLFAIFLPDLEKLRA